MQLLEQLIDWKALLCFATVCTAIELLMPLRKRGLFRAGLWTDALYVFVNSVLVRVGFVLVLAGCVALSGMLLPHALTGAISGQPMWLQIPEAIIVGDFCLYWAHRALHMNPFLWRVHAIHHAVRELDWLAAYHSHPLDELILAGAAFGAVCFLGFSLPAAAAYALVYAIFSVAVHLNARVSIGPLRWIFGSPEFHHWHHSNEPEARDRNFASIFSLWDLLFGTMFMPKGRMPEIYGIDDAVPDGYIEQLVHPFRRQSKSEASNGLTWPRTSAPNTARSR